MTISRLRLMAVLLVLPLLAACESDEERAREHFENGMALYEAGDTDRALVEFRNVLQLDESHREARLLVARIFDERGDRADSVRQYLRLVEQYPDVLEGQVALAEAAALLQDWEQAKRHWGLARDLDPADVEVRVVGAVLGYRDAIVENDEEKRLAAVADAELLLPERPESAILRNVLVDDRSRSGNYQEALEHIDAAIAAEPDNLPFHLSKIAILRARGDDAGIEAHLRVMVERFPDNEDMKAGLIRHLLDTGKPEAAEEFFRSVADPSAADLGRYVGFIQFLVTQKGLEAAIAELETTVATGSNPFLLRSMLAGLKFDAGATEDGIAEMRAVLADEPPVAQRDDLAVALAQMLAAVGSTDEAKVLIDEVLSASATNPEALKMRARWRIDADQAELAVTDLRSALEYGPGDTDAMQLLANAYTRLGSHELAQSTLADAVTSSQHAPGPTLRYAEVLVAQGSYRPAEAILVAALRNAPENVDILGKLGQVYALEQDFSRAGGVVDRLNSIGTSEALSVADRLRLDILARQERTGELLETLESMAADSGADGRARAMLIRGRLAAGDLEGALELAEEAVAENPDDVPARITLAATRAAAGDLPGAIAVYRDLVAAGTAEARVYRLLVAALVADGARDDAVAALREGRAAFPDDAELMWMDASFLEREGDIDGAIEIYDELYDRDSGALVVANNLASLLATYRSGDAAEVERAFNIARRLRGTEVPAFQDTYGWLLHLRGDSDEALSYLRPAAAALPDEPIVQYHFGMALLASGDTAAAEEQLGRALELAGPDDTRPQFRAAEAELERLRNPQPAGGTNNE